MTEIYQSIILGAIQGLGEFLPISSTAHLVLLPYFTGWKDPGLAFDVALHLGTLFAVALYFWKDWIDIFSSALSSYRKIGVKSLKTELLYFLVAATIPGALFGYLLDEKVETIFRSPLLIALSLIVAGFVLYIADRFMKGKKELADIGYKEAVIIGLSQALAVIPGVSRSGATITAGLFSGLSRMTAARFSFLLSAPIIFGAVMVKLPLLFRDGFNLPVIVGILSSAFFGYLAINYLLKFLERFGYGVFFWYRLGLGIVILASLYFRM